MNKITNLSNSRDNSSRFASRKNKLCMQLVAAFTLAAGSAASVAATLSAPTNVPRYLRQMPASEELLFANYAGKSATYSTLGPLDLDNEFFQTLGSNGRSCVNCHQPNQGWSITPGGVRDLFNKTKGSDPLFNVVDAAVSPDAETYTLKDRRAAYNLLLRKGLFRVSLPIPKDAEFELTEVDDPYNHAHAGDLSLFRRALPSTNLNFLSAVMWDGRETYSGHDTHYNLESQANNANLGHGQTNIPLTDAQKKSVVDFEMSLYSAQAFSSSARWLDAENGGGGARNLVQQLFYIGINDVLGDSQTNAPFQSKSFTLFKNWKNLTGNRVANARAAIERGERIFYHRRIVISGVPGINDNPAFGNLESFEGTCTTCHNAPNVGSHSTVRFVNIGLSDVNQRTRDLPLYTLTNKTTGEVVQTTDPGRALISGKWADIGSFKVPVLRNLAARAPYFHNGSAATPAAVVAYYMKRFKIELVKEEQTDLIAFLNSL